MLEETGPSEETVEQPSAAPAEAAPEAVAAPIVPPVHSDETPPIGDADAPPAKKPRPRATRAPRAPRKKKSDLEPAISGEFVAPSEAAVELPSVVLPSTESELMAASSTPPVDIFLQQLAEREVMAAGEPIPLHGRELSSNGPVARAEDVVVPDAVEETPGALEPFGEAPRRSLTGLPEITPELLAEVRKELPGDRPRRPNIDEAREPLTYRLRGKPGQPPREERPRHAPPPPVVGPAEILVPEAYLESVPEEWRLEVVEEQPELGYPEGPGMGGRKRRRRGRDRDREREREEPITAAPEPAKREPIVLGRDGEETYRPPRDRDRRDRDRDRPRDLREDVEPREAREHKEILINVDERETRIAVMENGRLVELHVEREERVVGGIYKARVANVLPGMDAAFVDIGLERNAFLYVGDILFEDPRHGERRTSRDVRIKDLVKPGQELLVQVVKGPRGTKGARVSTKISLPGRYLVLMPEGDHLGVSRKIEDARERDRLKRIADQLQPKGFGLIVRTEAEGRTEQELRSDLDYLVNTWKTIEERNKRTHGAACIQADLGIIMKTIRDLFGSDVDKLTIDSDEDFEKIVNALSQLAPDLVDRISLYEDAEPIFIRYNLEEEIDRLLRRKVWLRNGAYLLLDTTEALTTIDVNTGKFVGTSSLAETILKTNLDAVDEIARQLRLRDIGGMIVLDFIDMASARDRALVMRALENAFKKDRTRIKIAHISPLGLVEMTRKRTAENVTDVMSHVCPYCQGRGRVWSPETMAIRIERELMRMCATQEVDALLIYANPEVAAFLIGAEGESVEQLERIIRRPVYIRARHEYHIEKYEILPSDMLELERDMLQFHGGQVVECGVTKIELVTPPRSAAWVDGYFVDLANGVKFQGQNTRVRLTDVRRSFAMGEPVAPSTAVDRSEPI